MLTQYRGGDSYIDEHYGFTSAYGWGVMVFNATFDNISAISIDDQLKSKLLGKFPQFLTNLSIIIFYHLSI